ncbi:MAG: DUF362 domain-containing protein [Proteobacteria bacterium]|nr:DUF362 domain-containing protein [Pseudomonadota bacterium]
MAIVGQRDYEPPALEASIKMAIDAAGFDLASVRGRTVLLKPNMLGAFAVSMATTTHPEFVAAAGRIFKAAGATVWVGDSPNGVHPIDQVWETTGIRDACRREGLIERPFEAAGSEERAGFLISKVPLAADFVVNLPKFKTHSLTVMTLAVKNMYGCICGLQKSALHASNPKPYEFSEMCVRVAETVRPDLSIVDGIVAMEGNGPSGGPLRELGVIVAGTNMHAVDRASCSLIGLPPMEVDTIRIAVERGLWNESDGLDIAGDPIERLRTPDFALPATYTRGIRHWRISHFVTRLIWKRLNAQPVIARSRCVHCGLCVRSCPVSAIDWPDESGPPVIAKRRCIQCFCCHEACPHKAIDIRKSLPLKIWRALADRRARLEAEG